MSWNVFRAKWKFVKFQSLIHLTSTALRVSRHGKAAYMEMVRPINVPTEALIPTMVGCLVVTQTLISTRGGRWIYLRPMNCIGSSLQAITQMVVGENFNFNFSWCRHQMESFSALPAFCAWNSPVNGELPHKGQWRRAFMLSLICTWINAWVNNPKAGDLRRNRAYYDDIVIYH